MNHEVRQECPASRPEWCSDGEGIFVTAIKENKEALHGLVRF